MNISELPEGQLQRDSLLVTRNQRTGASELAEVADLAVEVQALADPQVQSFITQYEAPGA